MPFFANKLVFYVATKGTSARVVTDGFTGRSKSFSPFAIGVFASSSASSVLAVLTYYLAEVFTRAVGVRNNKFAVSVDFSFCNASSCFAVSAVLSFL